MKAPAQIPNNMKKELTSDGLLVNSAGQPIPELTFAEIDKTTIGGASPITLELIKCKQAIARAIARIDFLNIERILCCDEELLKEIRRESESLQADINLLIANRMEESLYSSDFKEI